MISSCPRHHPIRRAKLCNRPGLRPQVLGVRVAPGEWKIEKADKKVLKRWNVGCKKRAARQKNLLGEGGDGG